MTDSTRSPLHRTTPLVDEPAERWLELMVVLTRGFGAAVIVVAVWELWVLLAAR